MKTIDVKEAARLVQEGFEMTHGERMALQKKRLKTLVAYAREHSPFFKELYQEIPEDFSLEDLPAVKKSTLIDHYEDWVTDPEITLSKAREYCDRTTTDGKLFLDKYSVLHTSGTTGTPLYMVRDDHHNKIHGRLMYQRLLHGIDPDIMNHLHHRLAGVVYAVHGSSSYESGLRQKYSVPGYEDNLLILSVLDSIEDIVARLNEYQPESLSGYGSVLTQLALEKEAGRLNISVNVIFNSAENLSPENHALIEKAFGCPVKNNYCMTEGGEIAMTVDGPQMLLNEDWVIVEPVDENCRIVSDPGEWSGGILVTDLTNFVQPVIRYYVSDSVRIERIPDEQVRMPRFEIRGRVNEMFKIAGKTFSTSGLDSLAEFWKGVADFQFAQAADDELQLRIVWHSDAVKDYTPFVNEVKTYFDTHGCPAARVSWTDEPPVKNRTGGKTPRYIDLR